MRNERRERNQQVEQRLLQDIEVFSSPQFLRLMQRIGKEITDKHNAQIRFYSDALDHRADYFKGCYIYINTVFIQREKRNLGNAQGERMWLLRKRKRSGYFSKYGNVYLVFQSL